MNSANSTVDPYSHPETERDLRVEFEQLSAGDLIASRFQLVKPLGKGGMGSVWLAEQVAPVRRMVAIKFLRCDARTPRHVARFAREHQALAVMNHPHIAQIYDGGHIDEHNPFLVMEFVDGCSMIDYCDRMRLSVLERLKLLVKVCTAVEHAHQRGIIHRDLKPNNVLVGNGQDGLILKVIDFGLAKTLPWSDIEGFSTRHSEPGVAIGTPLYMAPEQVAGRDSEVGTCTDVYSLGIMLYELLAGEVPFGASKRSAQSWVDTFQEILHSEPPRASRSVERSERKSEISTARNTHPRALIARLRRDLDWIAVKALAKNPELRYESASALKRDLQRAIENKPIDAHPPSIRYQLARFISQHLLVSVASAIVLVAMSVGLVGMRRGQILAHAAERESRLALTAERAANERARLAIESLTDVLASAEFSGIGDEEKLLAQVTALHNLSESDLIPQDVRRLPADIGKKTELNGRVKSLREAVRILEHMNQMHPKSSYRSVSANVQFQLGRALERSGNVAEAETAYRGALNGLEQMKYDDHSIEIYEPRIAAICDSLGNMLVAAKRQLEGQAMLDRAANLRK